MISVGVDVSKEKSTVCIMKPYEMKKYRSQGLRRVKTDKQDAITICKYGLDYWYRLKNYEATGAICE